MNWIIDLLFPRRTGTIRISKDHLPGLIPPKAAPFTPRRGVPDTPPTNDIDEIYERYKGTEPKPKPKRSKQDRGVGF